MNKNAFTESFKKHALEIFMGFLKQGISYRKSYFGMVNALRESGVEKVPAYRSLVRWMQSVGTPKAEEQPATFPEKAEEQKYDPELLKRLLKAYRFRTEKSIDDLVDLLIPELED